MSNNNGFDYIKFGKELKHFIYPSTILPDTVRFEDGLKDVSIEKIKELVELVKEIKKMVIVQLDIAVKNSAKGSVERGVLMLLPTYHAKEYLMIRKWFRYWSEIWRKVSNKPLPLRLSNRLNHYGYFEVQQARLIPLESLYEGRLRRIGRRLTGLCPFHKEKTASFVIYEGENTFHCFGCGAHGDSINFIERTKELNFPEAMKFLL